MTKFFNELSPAELERLALLAEELGEAQMAIGKIIRHGYREYHPNNKNGVPNNRDDLTKELGHVLNAMEMMYGSGDLNRELVDMHRVTKSKTIHTFLHHQDN